MIILDTDHVSILQRTRTDRAEMLRQRLKQSAGPIRITVVTYEEQMRAWLALIAGERNTQRQVQYYKSLVRFSVFYRGWNLLEFDAEAAAEFGRLRKARVRISTMDLKIASIASTHDALLLSANLRDFERVPDLSVEDWLN